MVQTSSSSLDLVYNKRDQTTSRLHNEPRLQLGCYCLFGDRASLAREFTLAPRKLGGNLTQQNQQFAEAIREEDGTVGSHK